MGTLLQGRPFTPGSLLVGFVFVAVGLISGGLAQVIARRLMLAWLSLAAMIALGLASPIITSKIADGFELAERRWKARRS